MRTAKQNSFRQGDSFGKVCNKPIGAYVLRWVGDTVLIKKGNAVELMGASKA